MKRNIIIVIAITLLVASCGQSMQPTGVTTKEEQQITNTFSEITMTKEPEQTLSGENEHFRIEVLKSHPELMNETALQADEGYLFWTYTVRIINMSDSEIYFSPFNFNIKIENEVFEANPAAALLFSDDSAIEPGSVAAGQEITGAVSFKLPDTLEERYMIVANDAGETKILLKYKN